MKPSTKCTALRDGVRKAYRTYQEWLDTMPHGRLLEKHQQADLIFRRLGITFSVYGSEEGIERLIPFDVIPRILDAEEWRTVATGVCQRVRAINAFLDDVYHEQHILKSGRIPAQLVLNNPGFRPEVLGLDLPRQVYVHVAGVDVVRVSANDFYVLEDNARVPSGVSYMLENRETMMKLFPELFAQHSVAPVNHYPEVLLRTLRSVAPPGIIDPTVVVLTPGHFNSAYFEHAFLAMQMGVELVEGQDLFVEDDTMFMRTTSGPRRVDVIYRRIDDDFIDPLAFDANSMLGVPGLLSVVRNGRVTLGQRHRHRRRRRQGDLLLHSRHDRVLPRREADPEERPDLPLRPGRRSCLRRRSPGGAGGQGGGRLRRLRHAGGADEHGRAAQRSSATRCWRIPTTSSPSRPSTCRPCRPWSTARSCRGTSICGPTC